MVSIIVPVYKSEETLERCVSSLCAQTYENIEIILIVDGPPDGSGILAAKLAEENEKVKVVFQKNQGVSVSRNRGIEEAQGEYIRFVDSDDYVKPDSVECMVKAMESEKTDLVIAGYNHLYFGRTITKHPKYDGRYKTADSQEEVLELYQTGYLNMPWNKLYRREKIAGGFPTDLNLGEDLCFNLNYLKDTEYFTVIQKSVCEYIQDDRGTTLSTKRRMDKIPIAFRLFDTVRDILGKMYPMILKKSTCLESKLMTEFLDDLELLAFDKEISTKEQKEMIHKYEEAFDTLFEKCPNAKIELKLLDYKIIYFFYSRKMTSMTLIMIKLRGLVVKALKRR